MTSRAADRLIIDAVRHGGGRPAVLAAAALLGAAADLLIPMALGRAVDTLIGGSAGDPAGRAGWTWTMAAPTLVVLGLVVIAIACDAVVVLMSGVTGARAARWLRRRVVAHVPAVGPAVTGRYPPGDVVTRAGVNVEEAARAPEAAVVAAALVIPSAGSVVALTLIDPWLAVALVAGLVVITAVLRAFMRRTTAASGGYQQAQGEIAARLVTALAGARTIAAAATGEREARRVLTPLPRLRAHGLALWRLHARAGVQAAVVIPLLETAVLAVGGLRLAGGDLTVGELLAAARYVALGAGLGAAIGQVGRIARARSAAGRVERLLAEPAMPYGSRPLPAGPGGLELREVTVRVDGTPLLSDVDVVIPGGSCVAVVGRSGSGKSSLAAVAGRLADPDDGVVLLDGIPLPEIAHGALRRAVGYAFERPVLFGGPPGERSGIPTGGTTADTTADTAKHTTADIATDTTAGTAKDTVTDTTAGTVTGTIGGAIGFGLGGPDDGGAGHDPGHLRVRAAAAAACADAFIRRLPLGYATPVADAPMSGGELQRIGLARAFAQAGRLLILDDALSSLDTVTERQVTLTLTAGRLAGHTRLVVAHRAATAALADQVIWLDGGRVRARGRHEALWDDPDYRAVFQAAP
ncbi:ABC transporter transmembrane domain-containing protein [Sphaerimonospora sp. CA-214678]|uniref:ABC transporter transmembrane domain-containing protein n=1 Tax=Sphaerimonospora sp. CA-214678 TaxID=3240029 RepID=UPI003D90306A